ncbi:MAG: hypothetical protein KC457_23515 [Myxococcales bacterium]|nr:hypothetical protein [Myxococcales bacterium]
MARALLSPLGPLALLTLLALPSPVRAARPDATAAAPDPGKAGKTAPTEADAGAEIEIVVEKSRPSKPATSTCSSDRPPTPFS